MSRVLMWLQAEWGEEEGAYSMGRECRALKPWGRKSLLFSEFSLF